MTERHNIKKFEGKNIPKLTGESGYDYYLIGLVGKTVMVLFMNHFLNRPSKDISENNFFYFIV